MGKRLRRGVSALMLLAAVSGCWHDSDHRQDTQGSGTFIALGSLPGYTGSAASAISGDGNVVVGANFGRSGLPSGFWWTSSHGMTSIGLLPRGSFTNPSAASIDGTVIVGTADGGTAPGLHAFRWAANAGIVQLDGLDGSTTCAANDVSADGSVVAGTCLAPTNEAFRWTTATGTVGLGRFGPGSIAASTASAVSSDGQVVGGAGDAVVTGAVLWNAVGLPTIVGGLPGDSNGTITALSRDGKIASGVSVDATGHERAFRWTSTTGVVALQSDATLVATTATAISSDGARVAGYGGSANGGPDIALLWDASGALHRITDLLSAEGQASSAGWKLTRARGISGDGRVLVGEGINASGAAEAWVVVLRE